MHSNDTKKRKFLSSRKISVKKTQKKTQKIEKNTKKWKSEKNTKKNEKVKKTQKKNEKVKKTKKKIDKVKKQKKNDFFSQKKFTWTENGSEHGMCIGLLSSTIYHYFLPVVLSAHTGTVLREGYVVGGHDGGHGGLVRTFP